MARLKSPILTVLLLALIALLPYLFADTLPQNKHLPILDKSFQVVRNFMPDLLWAIGFSYSILFFKDIFSLNKNWLQVNIIAAFGASVFLEIAQHLNLIPGTADFLDCLAYLLGLFLGIALYRFQNKPNPLQNPQTL
jgi:hypothetical protein